MHSRQNKVEVKGRGAWGLGALACSLAVPVWAQEALTVEALQKRLEALERRVGGSAVAVEGEAVEPGLGDLDQRLRILERKLELQQEEQVAKAKEAAVVTVNDKGTSLKSANGDYEIKLRGLIQGDARLFLGGVPAGTNDTFLLRTARPSLEGSLGKLVAFRLTPEFAGESASLVDAYVDLRFNPAYTLRVGKFTSPVGLERLQSSAALSEIERALPSELAPNRDIGVQLQGEVAEGRVSYALGLFNGAVDGRDAATANPDKDFEVAGRLFFEPFKNKADALSGLGFGLGGSIGDKHGSGNNFLPRLRTPGQLTFFGYLAPVHADGRQIRLSPEAYYYRGGFGLLAEYIVSRQAVRVGAVNEDISNRAWQTTASYVLTGEDGGYRGVQKPAQPFDPGKGSWGAFELVGRYSTLQVDDAAFPLFANPAVSASQANAWVLGVNWYLSSNLKLVVNYLHTNFEGGAAAGADRDSEKAVFSRLQVAF